MERIQTHSCGKRFAEEDEAVEIGQSGSVALTGQQGQEVTPGPHVINEQPTSRTALHASGDPPRSLCKADSIVLAVHPLVVA